MAGADAVERRPTPAAAFARARELFRAGERIDMGALANDVGVARATLYRWTGDRERLLADVAWAEVDALLRYFERRDQAGSIEYMQAVANGFLGALADSEALRAFLANEGDTALRIMTAHDGGVRPRLVAAIGELIEAEAAAGYVPPDDPHILA